MDRSLFAFIWKHSKPQQIMLLGLTLVTFPFLYATLELPKRIINDAIGSDSAIVTVMGTELSQIEFLAGLCFSYLGAVLVHGLLKMRLNTMKGVVAERMLRRFRFDLISRMMRFPNRYFQNTSQGELVSMVTSEAEPMGGLMGDFLAQPVFQAGQMLIIVVFLFLQSVWFGLAGVALIPLQAYVIPMLQRQINLLNKERIKEVRLLAAEIGETAAGITDLRTNGGWRFRLAGFTHRLGQLFDIRFKIYQKKFFMKFLNNFITQLTPFFFYLVGGILAIQGQITVGALVAALAAYKDLSNPWKELLTYYNQTQDMALRWEIVTERFNPSGMIDEKLFEGTPETIPHLKGDISLKNVTVRTLDGTSVLENLSLEIPKGSQVAIQTSSLAERRAIAELLTREVVPTRGSVSMGGHDISGLHQAVIAARIGYVQSRPYLFQGTLGDNLLMSLRTSPKTVLWDPNRKDRFGIEARRSGNSMDSLQANWLDPALAELENMQQVHAWWFELSHVLNADEGIIRGMLDSQMNPDLHAGLAEKIVGLRDEVYAKLVERNLDHVVHRFDPEAFNPAVPLGGNLLFAAPKEDITQEGLAAEKNLLSMIAEQGLAEQAIAISQTLIETLHQTFGMDGTNHPLFTALDIDEALYERLVDISARRRSSGDGALSEEEFALLLTVPFAFTAEQIGPAFPESFKDEILNIRRHRASELRKYAKDMFVPISPETYLPRLTILENLIYGRISSVAGMQADLVMDAVSDVLRENNLRSAVATNIFDVPTTIGGTNLPPSILERAAFSRAGIKRPDVLVFDQAFIDSDLLGARERLKDLMPETTQIFLSDNFGDNNSYDMSVEINHGRVNGVDSSETYESSGTVSEDLRRKLEVIQRSDFFRPLEPRAQRLLAFAAQWYDAPAGKAIFSAGEPADATYLCLSGKAVLTFNDGNEIEQPVSTIEPGRVIGDLAVIVREPRQANLKAVEDSKFLRFGADEFRSVIENDKEVLLSLLQTVAGHLTGAASVIREARLSIPEPTFEDKS
ncbi:ABC transporter transmembrane domain-containing protein [Sulfitobacter donghicola]|uniref:ABC transporter ATP-binding protein n=1 Tax=Sulfitobacter donghicola DSW-25 = KCTC 12864 = JCM 14565 TaxID=1300350 RepID=A0A073ILV4_9RHOB|nr:ABC transporter transmembrane domain-containing protein [Sulfitobacter donghicola]KEJ90476.1 ABC transporter ATP-binding protein [Sulfitobacter donghicola DSW-25 = KCTC 12864 = JCM 14565]KIN67715.1 putative ABC transporter cyclic nucleotide-binding protein [Sulfitobacter donghicola DSW-25 = KCTC 12864 = JCM 14565]